jgi:hypothetical protein
MDDRMARRLARLAETDPSRRPPSLLQRIRRALPG